VAIAAFEKRTLGRYTIDQVCAIICLNTFRLAISGVTMTDFSPMDASHGLGHSLVIARWVDHFTVVVLMSASTMSSALSALVPTLAASRCREEKGMRRLVRKRCSCSSMRSSLSAIRRATSVSLCVIVCIKQNAPW